MPFTIYHNQFQISHSTLSSPLGDFNFMMKKEETKNCYSMVRRPCLLLMSMPAMALPSRAT
jgi:hypothetical protein